MTDYVDYSLFTSDNFDAKQYANSLLSSTTDRDELMIDFSSAQNKIKFDLEEVEIAVRQEIEKNWETLLERAEMTAGTTQDVEQLEIGLQNLAIAYERIANKAVSPYEEAEPLYEVLVNLGSTTALVRSLSRYMDNIALLDDAKDMNAVTDVLVGIDKCCKDNRALLQLRIVVSNFHKVDSKRSEVIRECVGNISNYKSIAKSVSALHKLNHAQMLKAVEDNIAKALARANKELKAGLEVSSAVRRLQNTDNAKAVSQYAQNLNLAFEELGDLAYHLQRFEDECPPDLLLNILETLCDSSASLKQFFWREVSGQISVLTRDAIRANQWIQRTLRSIDVDAIVSQGLQKGTMEYSVVFGSLSRK